MAKKRTKADRLQRQTEQLEKRVDRHPDEIEKKKTTREGMNQAAAQTTLAPKSDEPTLLIPIEQQIQQRAYELYEQRGRTEGHDLDDWLQAEYEIKGRQANAATAWLLAVLKSGSGLVAGDLEERLARYRQIKISVIRRKSGRTISIPVWFVLKGEKLYLLPVQGSETRWYQHVLQNPSIRIDARGVETEVRATPITEANAVKSVIEKFQEKYGAKDVKKYYSKFDVAVVVELG
jgi:hypothetical protein